MDKRLPYCVQGENIPLEYKLLVCTLISVASLMSQSKHLHFWPLHCYRAGQCQCCAPPCLTFPFGTDMTVFTHCGLDEATGLPNTRCHIPRGYCICMVILDLSYLWWYGENWRLPWVQGQSSSSCVRKAPRKLTFRHRFSWVIFPYTWFSCHEDGGSMFLQKFRTYHHYMM